MYYLFIFERFYSSNFFINDFLLTNEKKLFLIKQKKDFADFYGKDFLEVFKIEVSESFLEFFNLYIEEAIDNMFQLIIKMSSNCSSKICEETSTIKKSPLLATSFKTDNESTANYGKVSEISAKQSSGLSLMVDEGKDFVERNINKVKRILRDEREIKSSFDDRINNIFTGQGSSEDKESITCRCRCNFKMKNIKTEIITPEKEKSPNNLSEPTIKLNLSDYRKTQFRNLVSPPPKINDKGQSRSVSPFQKSNNKKETIKKSPDVKSKDGVAKLEINKNNKFLKNEKESPTRNTKKECFEKVMERLTQRGVKPLAKSRKAFH